MSVIIAVSIVAYIVIAIAVGRSIFNHYIAIEYSKQLRSHVFDSDVRRHGSKEAAAYANAKLRSDADVGATFLGVFWPVTGLWVLLYIKLAKFFKVRTVRFLPANDIQKQIAEIEREKQEIKTLQNTIEAARNLGLNVKGLEDIVRTRTAKK